MSETIMIGAIIGISEIFKKSGVSSKFIPIINLILGIVLCSLYSSHLLGDIYLDVFQGIIIGLTASGLYSGAKNVSEGMNK